MGRRRAWAVEFIGTLMFVTIGAGSVIATNTGIAQLGGLLGVAAAHGLAFAIVVGAFANISGGHLNPAVTLSLWIGGRIRSVDALAYIVAQLAGGVAAGGLLLAIFGKAGDAAQLGTPGPRAGLAPARVILIEAVFTFFLVLVFWATLVDERGRTVAGFGVGLMLFVTMLVAGQLTGGVVNPARHFGPALVAGYFRNWWLYWVGPGVGAAVAGLFYPTLLLDRHFPWRLVPAGDDEEEGSASSRSPKKTTRP